MISSMAASAAWTMIQAELDAHETLMPILLPVAVTVPKKSSRLQTQMRQKTADQMKCMGACPGGFP
jgi:hypothetical protein